MAHPQRAPPRRRRGGPLFRFVWRRAAAVAMAGACEAVGGVHLLSLRPFGCGVAGPAHRIETPPGGRAHRTAPPPGRSGPWVAAPRSGGRSLTPRLGTGGVINRPRQRRGGCGWSAGHSEQKISTPRPWRRCSAQVPGPLHRQSALGGGGGGGGGSPSRVTRRTGGRTAMPSPPPSTDVATPQPFASGDEALSSGVTSLGCPPAPPPPPPHTHRDSRTDVQGKSNRYHSRTTFPLREGVWRGCPPMRPHRVPGACGGGGGFRAFLGTGLSTCSPSGFGASWLRPRAVAQGMGQASAPSLLCRIPPAINPPPFPPPLAPPCPLTGKTHQPSLHPVHSQRATQP